MRKVGRPRGPSLKTSKELDQIADLIVSKKATSANNAIVQVIADRPKQSNTGDFENARRSLHRWWKRQKDDRLSAAKERRQEKYRTPAHTPNHSTLTSLYDALLCTGLDPRSALSAGLNPNSATAAALGLGVVDLGTLAASDALSALGMRSAMDAAVPRSLTSYIDEIAAVDAARAENESLIQQIYGVQNPSLSAFGAAQAEVERIRKTLYPWDYMK